MPGVVRFISFCILVGCVAYAGLFALAHTVEPKEREIVTTVTLHPKRPEPAIPSAGVRTRTAATAADADDLFDKLQSLPFAR
jgi:hypothetical protein